MFLTRFTRVDGAGPEDYLYNSYEEARNHFDLFLNDDSKLYRNICVIGENMEVLCILPFDNKGNALEAINLYEQVRLLPEYASEAERELVFVATALNEQYGGRVDITYHSPNGLLPSTETVDIYMIEPLGYSDEVLYAAKEKRLHNA